MMRVESKRRARALQMLYSLELVPDFDGDDVSTGLSRLTGPEPGVFEDACTLVDGVVAQRDQLDELAQSAATNWRLDRIGAIERNILRLAIHELMLGVTPPKAVIDEAIWLAQRFAGPKAPSFINGVLDRVARDLRVL
jgi:N utilization substance protein B